MLVSTVLLALCLGQSDPADLVKKLGSSRFAERESAYEALGSLGSEALDTLRTATSSADAEVRARAAELVARIESRMLVEPTLVRLDFQDRPIGEVMAEIGQRGGVSLTTMPEPLPGLAGRRITLESDEPLPIWSALERLCTAANLQPVGFPIQLPGGPRSPGRPLVQLAMAGEAAGPSCVSGPFRVSLLNVAHHRDRSFGPTGFPAAPVFVNPNGVPVARRARPGDNRAGRSTESFVVSVQVMAEPRLAILQNGAIRVIEARDEQGRSLLPENAGGDTSRTVLPSALGGQGSPVIQISMPLQLPEQPGSRIQDLRAEIPVTVMARKAEPLRIDLRDAKGKTFEDDGRKLIIHDVRAEPMQNATLLDLTIRLRREGEENPSGLPFGTPEFLVFRQNPGQPGGQVEFVDAQGRSIGQWFTMSQTPENEGLRLTLRLISTDGVGAPAELRLYNLARAETTIAFILRDIPMP